MFFAKRLYEYYFKKHLEYYYSHHYCHGDPSRLHLGKSVSTMNTIFNLSSGQVFIGDNTIFGHNCMVLTGKHTFVQGKRKLAHFEKNKTPSGKKLTLSELSSYLQYSEQFIRKRVMKIIPHIMEKGEVMFFKEEIDSWLHTKDTPITGNDIIIGDGCWIASGAIILGSVTIGNDSIIGANSLVTKDVPSGVFVAGVPAKIIKELK